MLQQPPNVGDILLHGSYDITKGVHYYGYETFIVESIDKGKYTLRLNSSVVTRRGTVMRHFIKKSKEKRVVDDAELAAYYSEARGLFEDELKEVAERYLEFTGVKV
jgi:hypothetical protein